MNFQELLTKISELDNPVMGEQSADQAKTEEVLDVEECGMPGMDNMPSGMMGMRGSPPQQDSINANVSLNASGAGGIKDLMNILRNIEQGDGDSAGDDLGDLIGAMGDEPQGREKVAVIGDDMPVDEYANEPDEVYGGMAQAIPTGNDLHSKGIEAPKVNGGGNPMQEELVQRLTALYNSIKSQ